MKVTQGNCHLDGPWTRIVKSAERLREWQWLFGLTVPFNQKHNSVNPKWNYGVNIVSYRIIILISPSFPTPIYLSKQ